MSDSGESADGREPTDRADGDKSVNGPDNQRTDDARNDSGVKPGTNPGEQTHIERVRSGDKDPSTLTEEQLSGADLPGIEPEDVDWEDMVLEGTSLREADLTDVDLPDATLTDVDLRNATLTDVDLRNATLDDVDLRGATVEDTDLVGADLVEVNLRDADVGNCVCIDVDVKSDSILRDVDFEDCNFTSAELSDVRGANATFLRSRLLGTDFADCSLPHVEFVNSTLSDCCIKNSNLRDATVRGEEAEPVDAVDMEISGTNLSRATVDGVDLTVADVDRTTLTGLECLDSRLDAADLSGSEVRIDHAEFEDCRLHNVDMRGARLRGTNFTHVELQDANLGGANLIDGEFRDSKMQRAHLDPPDGAGITRFEDGLLTRVDIRGAQFDDVALYQTILTDVRLNEQTDFDDKSVYAREDQTPDTEDEVTPQQAAANCHRHLESVYSQNDISNQEQHYHVQKKRADKRSQWDGPDWKALAVILILLSVVLSMFVLGFPAIAPTVLLGAVMSGVGLGIVHVDDDSQNRLGYITLGTSGALTRYGESLKQLISAWVAVPVLFAFAYVVIGTPVGSDICGFIPEQPVGECGWIDTIGQALILSFATFTAVNLSIEAGSTSLIALFRVVEAGLGTLLFALFVFVLGRKTER